MTNKVSKFISKLFSKVVWVLSITLIILVLIISLFKLTLPYWLKQKESIIAQVESYIGGEVEYQSLQVDWSDFHPIISVDDFQWVSSDQTKSIKSKINVIEVNIWQTLYHGDLVTNEIELKDIDVRFKFKKDESKTSSFNVNNLKDEVKDLIDSFNHQYISLKEMKLAINDSQVGLQQIPQLVFKQEKEKKQLIVDTFGELANEGRLVIETEGTAFADGGKVDYFFDFKNINLKLLSDIFFMDGFSAYQKATVKLWAAQTNELIDSARLEIFNDTSELAKLDVVMNLAQSSERYTISSERFDIALKQGSEYINHNSFVYFDAKKSANKNAPLSYQMKTGYLPVGFVAKIAAPLLSKEHSELLVGVNPSGIIKALDLSLMNSSNGFFPTDGKVELSEVTTFPYLKIPGTTLKQVSMNGVDGNWEMQALVEERLFDWKPILKVPVTIDKLLLNTNYNISQPNDLKISRLVLENKDVKVKARGALNFSDDISMAIYSEAEDINVANLHYYWPREVGLNPKTIEYLEESLLDGKVPFAKFVWQGSVDAFPFKEKDGQFDIQAEASNIKFLFEPDWPVARNINAKVSFENEKLTVNATRGNLLGAKVKSAKAILPDLEAPNEEVLIDIKAESDFASYQQIYQQSPLKNILGEELVKINFSEKLNLDLDLDLLLKKEDVEVSVDGLIDFQGNNIQGIPYNIKLSNTLGQLRFTDTGAISKNLTANLFGNPINIELKVDEFTDNDSFLQIDATGQVNLSNAAKQIIGFSPLQTKGLSKFFVHYKSDEKGSNESLIIRSNLIGTSIKGPDWLAKKIDEKEPFLATIFKVDDTLKLRTSYSNQLSSQLDINMTSLLPSGVIKLGSMATQTVAIPNSGVAIEGYFDEIKVAEWLDAIHVKASEEGDWPDWIDRINITTPYLEFAGLAFTKVRINDARDDLLEQEFRFNLFSEQARANLIYLKNGQKKLAIENLNINFSDNDASELNISDDTIQIALEQYDNWTFECQRCKVNGYEFGPVSLTSNYQDGAIKIKGDAFVGDQLSSAINGEITHNNTELKFDFDIPNPDGLLKYWGLDGDVRDTETVAALSLAWPGRLHDFSLNKTNGYLKLDTKDGSIKNLSDSKARIFSLFSLQSIPRRLSLDFSDLFTEGFFYDKITGHFAIEKGVLITEKVEIDGTAADVAVNGKVDLNNQTVDQQVIVTPKLGSSLPVLAGWALEPTTGIIMLIVSKIFEPALNVVSSIEYKISGDLEDPEVVEVSKKSKEVKVTEEQIEQQKQLLESATEQSTESKN